MAIFAMLVLFALGPVVPFCCLCRGWWIVFLVRRRSARPFHGRRQHTAPHPQRNNRKPDWVVREIVRLRAHLPYLGFDKLAQTFNRLHAETHGVTVSKSYVHYTVRANLEKIAQLRRDIKRRTPAVVDRNAVWGVDMTGKADTSGCVHAILGILDHGTRFPLELAALTNKASWTLLGHLCLAIGRYGKPVAIRTDNERCFTSRVFTLDLRCFGIRHQRIDIACPWQNGRVERFFGTLKQPLDRWTVESHAQLQRSLDLFRDWYCTVRPHAHLDGATPYEAWHGIDPYRRAPKHAEWFEAWDGLLTGYRIRYR